jgi:hypothetical protein
MRFIKLETYSTKVFMKIILIGFSLFLTSISAFGQLSYERMKYAIEHNDVSKVSQLLDKETRNKEAMKAWSFKMAAGYDRQNIMKFLYNKNMACDPVWFNTLVLGYWNENRKNDVEYWGLRSLALIETQLGKDHEEYAYGLRTLGLLYFRQGNYGSANQCLRQAQVILTKSLGESHKETIELKETIAALDKEMGN